MENRILFIRSVLSVALATSVLSLTACGGGGGSSSGNTADKNAETNTPTKPATTNGTASKPATTGSDSSGNNVGTSTLTQKDLLARINKVRSQGRYCYANGKKWYKAAPAIQWSSQLEIASKNFADDMAKHNYYNYFGDNAHVQPDTSQAKVNGKYTVRVTLMDRVGATQYLIENKIGGSAGENLAWSRDSANPDVDTALDTAYKNWLASTSEHCETIMEPKWKDFSMSGAYNKTTGKYYFVQLFGEQQK